MKMKQMKKLFDIGELEPGERTAPEDNLVLPRSFFLVDKEGKSTSANANNSVIGKTPQTSLKELSILTELNRSQASSLLATKNQQGGLGDSEDKSLSFENLVPPGLASHSVTLS